MSSNLEKTEKCMRCFERFMIQQGGGDYRRYDGMLQQGRVVIQQGIESGYSREGDTMGVMILASGYPPPPPRPGRGRLFCLYDTTYRVAAHPGQ